MKFFKTQLLRISAVFFLGIYCAAMVQAQNVLSSLAQIEKAVADPSQEFNTIIHNTCNTVVKNENWQLTLNKLESQTNNHISRALFFTIKATSLYLYNTQPATVELEPRVKADAKPEILALHMKAMNEAYLSGNDRLIAQISLYYGQRCYVMKELELAVTYTMNGLELNEKLNISNSPVDYMVVGEILYRIKEYQKSIAHSLKAFYTWQAMGNTKDTLRMMWSSNTAAIAYQRQQKYDSAFLWHKKSMQLANELHHDIWKGIICGNMGQIYYEQKKYDTALSLLENDYIISKREGLYDNAANSLQWAARTHLQMGNTAAALEQVRAAFALLRRTFDAHYFRNACYTATEVFKAVGMYDSAFYYNTRYSTLNDSLEKVIAVSGIAVSRARANDEKSKYHIQSLQKEKQTQLLQRNILIAAVVLLGILGFLFISRQRLKAKLQLERMEEEKKQMEKEIAVATEQLKMFTENIVEKTNLISKLEEQIKDEGISAERQLLMNELSRQTILTEVDWLKFKELFEKIYPAFFQQLKQKAADITLAEQRMAALTRLQLTSRQMAAMLDISVDSVHKTRQRLRQRFQLEAGANLEKYIAEI
ncbi:tetratricopeptide repeat protein [Lacibacter luteus]|uniref:Tetratricopeptide repeat protein n=1 Tax=Lacibacter luteus TaxID=2508719 RepID=A0A4Q1CH94_9BACT|nr:tetratricopeptide repeat protein [Lacibacter luteus]RXK59683.1 tetratricopeptide repeat protein [Lacibacter luteus]